MSSMRALMITPDYPPQIVGGCALSCQLLVDGLRSRGLYMDVYAFNGDKRPEVVKEMGTVKYFSHSETLFGLNLKAAQAVERASDHYDLVHIYNCQQIPTGVLYAKRHGAKAVATLNNMVPLCTNPSDFDEMECMECNPLDTLQCALHRQGGWAMRTYMPVHWTQFNSLRRFAKQLDACIALSEETKRYYVNSGFDPERIHVIPNMYDPRMVEKARGTPGPTNKNRRSIIYVGRLEREKGLQTLMEALSLMDRRDVQVILVGKGSFEQELRSIAKHYGVNDRVIFTGFVPPEQTSRYYAEADVFVHPALWPEPFARTLLESLAYRIPLVVSDKGPSAKILGGAAMTFRCGDAEHLAEVLGTVLADRQRRAEMQAHGEVVLSKYSPDTVLPQIMRLYEETLAR